jgi:hypothetical protein
MPHWYDIFCKPQYIHHQGFVMTHIKFGCVSLHSWNSWGICNHVLAVLYKINYAYNKQYISPACTSFPQGWNKGTQKEVNPSKVKNLTFRLKSWPWWNIE